MLLIIVIHSLFKKLDLPACKMGHHDSALADADMSCIHEVQ